MIYYNNKFVKYISNIQPSELTEYHQVLIENNKNNGNTIQLINMNISNSYYTIIHNYSPGIYYLKIKGGLTGFKSLSNNFYQVISTQIEYQKDKTSSTEYTIEEQNIQMATIYLEQILSWGSETNWNTLNNAFNSAKKLRSIPNTQMPNVNDAISCFYGCSSLTLPKISNLLPNALINSTSMFENSGISGNINYLTIPPYNTIIDKIFYNTRITELPKNFNQKKYYSKESITGSVEVQPIS